MKTLVILSLLTLIACGKDKKKSTNNEDSFSNLFQVSRCGTLYGQPGQLVLRSGNTYFQLQPNSQVAQSSLMSFQPGNSVCAYSNQMPMPMQGFQGMSVSTLLVDIIRRN